MVLATLPASPPVRHRQQAAQVVRRSSTLLLPRRRLTTDGAAPVFGGQMCGLFSSNKVTSEAVACRNGSIRKGDRVQTQYEREEGGDDRWYCGVVVEAYTNGKVR